jgi:tetratricopeptide (TPR) repeat protein
LESREFSAATKAYARAAQLAPNNALILGGYGRSLLAQNTKSSNAQALKILQKARNLDSRDARILRDIGTAFARSGQQGQAVLAIAERYALARQYAKCRHTGQTGRRPLAARLGGMAKGAGYFGRVENALVGSILHSGRFQVELCRAGFHLADNMLYHLVI